MSDWEERREKEKSRIPLSAEVNLKRLSHEFFDVKYQGLLFSNMEDHYKDLFSVYTELLFETILTEAYRFQLEDKKGGRE